MNPRTGENRGRESGHRTLRNTMRAEDGGGRGEGRSSKCWEGGFEKCGFRRMGAAGA
jgi:hypothetical protein